MATTSSSSSNNAAVLTFKPRPSAKARIFCLPFGGGTAAAYRDWSRYLIGFEVCAVQLPGRGSRFEEKPETAWPRLIGSLLEDLAPKMREKPFFLFGHSLGALIAFELARALAGRPQLGGEEEEKAAAAAAASNLRGCLFSGHFAPHLARLEPNHADLDDEAFERVLQDYNGTPPEVLASKELMASLLPTIRADFKLAETYDLEDEKTKKNKKKSKLDLPFVCYGGMTDLSHGIHNDRLAAWAEHTARECVVRVFPGGHFFHQELEELFVATVQDDCTRLLSQQQQELLP